MLLRLGIATFECGAIHDAKKLLLAALAAAEASGAWSLEARASITLSNLAWMAEYDVDLAQRYALRASSAAAKAGDQFDRRTSMLALLGIASQRGDSERVAQLETQVSESLANDSEQSALLVESQAHRAAWEGHPAVAHRLFGSIFDRQSHYHDRCGVRAFYCLCLALDPESRESQAAQGAALWIAPDRIDAKHLGLLYVELARLMVALAEIVAGRHTSAGRMLKGPPLATLAPAAALRECVEELARVARRTERRSFDLSPQLERLNAFGLGCYARYVTIAQRHLERVRPERERHQLTRMEIDALRALAAGRTPKEIAQESGRSLLTVQTHIKNAMEKLDAHGRASAISNARRLGYLEAVP